MTSHSSHLRRRAHAAPAALPLAPSASDERRVRDTAHLRTSHLRRRFGLEDSTARLIASLAYGDPRQ